MVWVLEPGHNATHSLQIEACLRTNSRPRSLSLLIGSRHYESYSHSDLPAEIHTEDQLVPSLPLCVCVCVCVCVHLLLHQGRETMLKLEHINTGC